MRRKRGIYCLLCAVVLMIASFGTADMAWSQDGVWDLATDFTVSPIQANPNPDADGNLVWHFLATNDLVHHPDNYTPMTGYNNTMFNINGIEQWYRNLSYSGTYNTYAPTVSINASGSDQTVAQYAPFTWPAGAINMHPGPNSMAIVGWRSPFTGFVAVSATFSEMDPHGADGINWYIEQGATPLASGSLPGGGIPQSWSATYLPVNKGDFLYFIVDPAGSHSYDSTRLDLTIRRSGISDLAADFAVSPIQANPTPDADGNLVWHFLATNDLVHHPDNYTPMTGYNNTMFDINGMEQWYRNIDYSPTYNTYSPTVSINASGSDQLVAEYAPFTWPAGAVNIHPGPNSMAIVGWQSPFNGSVDVSATFAEMDPHGYDGINWYIEHGALRLASGTIPVGGASQTLIITRLSVKEGEFLYVIVDPAGTHYYDSTRLDLVINRVN